MRSPGHSADGVAELRGVEEQCRRALGTWRGGCCVIGLMGVEHEPVGDDPAVPHDERLAHALEIVGERWALLIVRDLTMGPRRFTDLASARSSPCERRSTPEAAAGVQAGYELRVADLVIELPEITTLKPLLGAAEAVASGRARITGDLAEFERFVTVFGLTPSIAQPMS